MLTPYSIHLEAFCFLKYIKSVLVMVSTKSSDPFGSAEAVLPLS